MLILDLWGISFHAGVVFGLGKNLLSKSTLGRCVLAAEQAYSSTRQRQFKDIGPPAAAPRRRSGDPQLQWWRNGVRRTAASCGSRALKSVYKVQISADFHTLISEQPLLSKVLHLVSRL